jgi:hypothetical protein
MLPQTPYVDPSKNEEAPRGRDGKPRPVTTGHESINDLPVHSRTTQQIFYPVPESRAFTRADAGKAFHPNLRPADERIPHPELIEIEKFKGSLNTPALAKFKLDLAKADQDEALRKVNEERERERQTVKVYTGARHDFKFQDISVESVGKTGRSRAGVGWRYGMPHEDRKPGQVKIPTSVA